jgi:hypothetical protein
VVVADVLESGGNRLDQIGLRDGGHGVAWEGWRMDSDYPRRDIQGHRSRESGAIASCTSRNKQSRRAGWTTDRARRVPSMTEL